MAKRLELVLGPGDFEKHGFQAILGAQKSSQKFHTFSELIIFSRFTPWDPSHPLSHAQKTSSNALVKPCDLRWRVSFNRFFVRQKFHFGKIYPIS